MSVHQSDRGSATVLSIALGAIIVGAGSILLSVLQLAIIRAELGSYADLAALAASSTASDSCAAAAQISELNQVELVECSINSTEVTVTVQFIRPQQGVLSWLARDLQVSARATYLPVDFL